MFRRINIERYDNPEQIGYSALIEGVRDDGTGWIMWLDNNGSPSVYFARRDETGAVISEGVDLESVGGLPEPE